MKKKPIQERLFPRLKQQGECLVWTGCVGPTGYGHLPYILEDGTKMQFVHRIAYFLENGDFDRKLSILHRCDNRPCCNPAHLFLGTQKDNVKDMFAKGRANKRHGELNNAAKITNEDAKTIRHLFFAERRKQKEIGGFFGLTQGQISKVCRRDWGNQGSRALLCGPPRGIGKHGPRST